MLAQSMPTAAINMQQCPLTLTQQCNLTLTQQHIGMCVADPTTHIHLTRWQLTETHTPS